MKEARAWAVADFMDKMDTILAAVADAKAILNDAVAKGLLDEIEAKRADLYWQSAIEGAVNGGSVMHSMWDTLDAIRTGDTD